jgi:hypothetical protein
VRGEETSPRLKREQVAPFPSKRSMTFSESSSRHISSFILFNKQKTSCLLSAGCDSKNYLDFQLHELFIFFHHKNYRQQAVARDDDFCL